MLGFTGVFRPVPRDFEVNSPTAEEFNSSPPWKSDPDPKRKGDFVLLSYPFAGASTLELHRCILLVYIQGYIIDMIDGFNRPTLPETDIAPENTRRFLFETTIFRGENASFRQGKFETSIPFDVTFRNQKPKNSIGSSFRQGSFSVWKTSHILVWYDPNICFATWQDFWTCNFTI